MVGDSMKIINRIIIVGIAIFLFFSFSNFKSVNDIVQYFSSQITINENLISPNKTETNQVTQEETQLEKAIIKSIVDGDTIKVELSGGQEETIRLLLIDTPETVSPNTPEQPFGKEASDYMQRTLIKDTVIEIERGINERDKYDRLLAYIWKNGTNINKELIKEGLAR